MIQKSNRTFQQMSDKHEKRARAFVVAHVEREFVASAARVAMRAEMRRRAVAAQRDRDIEAKHSLTNGFMSGQSLLSSKT